MRGIAKHIVTAGRLDAIDFGGAQQALEHARIGNEFAHFEHDVRPVRDAAGLRNQMRGADDQFKPRDKLQYAGVARPRHDPRAK